MPCSQITATGMPLLGTSGMRCSNSWSGIRWAPGMWALTNSGSVRTSSTTMGSPIASFR